MGKPKIRFKGFDDDWEQRKLGDVLERRIEQRQQSKEYPRLAFASGQGVIPLSERKTNNREQLTKDEYTKKYLVTELNDIVYNPANVKYGAIDRNKCGRGLISPIYVTFTTSEISGFIERIVTSHDFQQRALRFEEGTVTKRQSVNPEDLVTLDILVASKREEQQKIATYFDSLDNLITLHQRKCDETKKLKKYMLQKMFPQNGQTVPEIRFSGFTDVWEQRKLGEITVKIGSGKTPSGGKSAYVETGIPLIRSQNVNNDKVDFADVVYIDKSTDESMSNSRVYTNDVLLNITGASIGRSAVYKGVESANVNQHVCIIRQIEGYQSDFIQLNLSSDNGQKQIDASQAGGGREGLNFQEIGKMQFSFPTLNEQKCIGRYFNNLDHLITLHQQKCDELRNIKKFMLQNMFA